ncbi:aryl-sulfate sulfotransferase [bacterium]|nr:aryl-sulfate sulfotransferase [bacterium]
MRLLRFFIHMFILSDTAITAAAANSPSGPVKTSNPIFQINTAGRSLASASRPRILSNGVAVPGDFPVIQTQQYGETAPGRIFFSCTFFDDNSRGNYLVICNNDGTPYFYRRYPRYPTTDKGTADFRVQDDGLLSFHQYVQVESGVFYVMDEHFTEIDTFDCGPDFRTDNHEFLMLPNGHALLIAEEDSIVDMSQIVSGGNTRATVQGNHIQELDSDGNLYWEWRSWDHLNIADCQEVNLRGYNIDYVHLNSIAVDYDGNYIISLRHFDEVAKIDSGTGDFIWRLGGVNNQFTFVNEEVHFLSQHHVRPVPDKPDHYTIYDNGNQTDRPDTRAVEYKIDPVAMTAEKVWEYNYSKVGYSYMMGSVQRLPNGNTYMDWSDRSPLQACEVDSNNNLLFEIEVAGVSGYRSYRFDWEGQMIKPDLIVESRPDGVVLIMNQFNDPDVDYFRIYHDTEPGSTALLDTSKLTLKNLTGLENRQMHYFRVTSVNTQGEESGFSNEASVLVKVVAPGENQIINGDFSEGSNYWEFMTNGFIEAEGDVEDGAFHLEVDSVVGFGMAYVYQYPVSLVEDAVYVLEFDVSANKTLQMVPAVVSGTGNTDYARIGAIQATTETIRHSYEFTQTRSSTSDALVAFGLEMDTGEIVIDNVVFRQITSGIGNSSETLPGEFRFNGNYPNPFNGTAAISFELPVASEVTINLYDILGKQHCTIHRGTCLSGSHRVLFNDHALPSGVYFIRMEARNAGGRLLFQETRKMTVLR